jgi:hypothetical protein
MCIGMPRPAPSTSQRSGIRSVLLSIFLVDVYTLICPFDGQQVAWLLLLAAWLLNLYPEMITTVTRETFNGESIVSRADCLRIGVINMIPGDGEVIPLPIVHLVVGFVKHSPIFEQKAGHHSPKVELLPLWCSQISWNCDK